MAVRVMKVPMMMMVKVVMIQMVTIGGKGRKRGGGGYFTADFGWRAALVPQGRAEGKAIANLGFSKSYEAEYHDALT